MSPLKTPTAARQLGVTYHQLIGLIRYGKMEPPARDTSGDYYWTAADVQRAREAIRTQRRKVMASGQ